MNLRETLESAQPVLVAFGLNALGALVAYVVGRKLISFATKLVTRVLERQSVDPTITRYIGSVISVALNIILIVAILGYFGVETTSFAALVAGLGLAIGAAWGGLLSNFAAGAFILVLRPFKAGDYVAAGGVEGTVRMIGLFSTTIDTGDNVQTLVGNATGALICRRSSTTAWIQRRPQRGCARRCRRSQTCCRTRNRTSRS